MVLWLSATNFQSKTGQGRKTADEGRHAAIALGIFARLRTVGFVQILHRLLRRAGQIALLRHARESLESMAQIGFGRAARKTRPKP